MREWLKMGDRTLLLVDGHSLAFRSYYAFAYRADGGLRTSTGIPTSICYGFLSSLLEFLKWQQPDAVAIAFDLARLHFAIKPMRLTKRDDQKPQKISSRSGEPATNPGSNEYLHHHR
jgi:5'-3' exonuclease